MTSDELLAKAILRFAASRAEYRDAMVETGQLLHCFILSRLEAADQLNEAERRTVDAVRSKVVMEIVKALRVDRSKVAELLRIAAVADLFSDGNLGSLSYSDLRAFTRLVRRAGKGKFISRSHRDGGEKPSEWERWIACPKHAAWSKELFVKARDEDWPHDEIVSAIGTGMKPTRAREKDDAKPQRTTLDNIAANAAPRDLASMILDMIAKSLDPGTVSRIVGQALTVKHGS